MSTKNILRKIFKIYQFIFTITLLLSSMNNSKFLFPRDFFNKIGRPIAQENKQLSLHYPRTLCPKSRAHDSGKEIKCEKLQDRETVHFWGDLTCCISRRTSGVNWTLRGFSISTTNGRPGNGPKYLPHKSINRCLFHKRTFKQAQSFKVITLGLSPVQRLKFIS